jgi:hypothetical protein
MLLASRIRILERPHSRVASAPTSYLARSRPLTKALSGAKRFGRVADVEYEAVQSMSVAVSMLRSWLIMR